MFTTLVKNTPWPRQAPPAPRWVPLPAAPTRAALPNWRSPGQLLLVITADTSSALALERELPFFLAD